METLDVVTETGLPPCMIVQPIAVGVGITSLRPLIQKIIIPL
jgi:hypothetical protein